MIVDCKSLAKMWRNIAVLLNSAYLGRIHERNIQGTTRAMYQKCYFLQTFPNPIFFVFFVILCRLWPFPAVPPVQSLTNYM